MKNLIGSCLAIVCVAGMSNAFAHGDMKVCKPVLKACKDAGKKGKDMKTCVEAVKAGNTPAGVTVSAADVTACQAAK